PQAQPSGERIDVVAGSCSLRQLLQAPRIAAAQDHIVDLENLLEPHHHIRDSLPPLLVAQPPAAALSGIILEGTAVLVGHVSYLHRLDGAIQDQCRAKPRTEAEEEHSPPGVPA